ncbi:MAG: hypothetical protein AAFX80_20110 [Cyanobacteria bacterium J06639_18]
MSSSEMRKGQKGAKNVPYIYSEVKKDHTLKFTPTAWELLKREAKKLNVSVSEMIERWIRDTAG